MVIREQLLEFLGIPFQLGVAVLQLEVKTVVGRIAIDHQHAGEHRFSQPIGLEQFQGDAGRAGLPNQEQADLWCAQ